MQQRLCEAEWVGISILSQIEFLVFPDITPQDRQVFQQFSDRVDVVGLDRSDAALIDRIVEARQQHRLKQPDTIIAATALERNATLITDDTQLRRLRGLKSMGITDFGAQASEFLKDVP